MLNELEELALQVSHLIPLIWFRCEGYFKGSSVIKYTYLVCPVVCLSHIWITCFYGLLGGGVFRFKMELFAKLINNWQPLISKIFILDVLQGSEYASAE